MRKQLVFALFLLFATGGTISTSERTDDWWLDPSVTVSVEYQPYFIPKQLVKWDECSKLSLYVAPWVREVEGEISAYNSEVGQTDDSPWIAANNRRVFPGGIASNVLPCGTKVMIPDLFGDQVFIVNDRLNRRYDPFNPKREKKGVLNFDVWMLEKRPALQLGRKRSRKVVIVEYAGV